MAKRRFGAAERVFVAEQNGIEPWASQAAETERRLLAQALARNASTAAFDQIARRLTATNRRDERLLEKYLTFGERARKRHLHVLVSFADVPRARREMLRLARTARGATFGDVAISVGRMGNRNARVLLRQRVRELARDIERLRGRRVPRRLAEACGETAWALLQTDPDATLAANVLVRMMREPKRYGQGPNTVAFMRDVITAHGRVGTTAVKRVRDALRSLLEPGSDEENFADAVQALVQIDSRATLERAASLLESNDRIVRIIVAGFVSMHAPDPVPPLVRYLAKFPSDWMATSVARRLGSAVPMKLRLVVAAHGLAKASPRERLDAALYLRSIGGPRARDLARRARRHDPEPLVRAVLATASWNRIARPKQRA